MKLKAKVKDLHLIVTVKMGFGEAIDDPAMADFTRIFLRGFLKPRRINNRTVEYYGPVGVCLKYRLQKKITQRDFLFIIEQLVLAVQKIQANNMDMNMALLNLDYVFINEVTKELQILYIPRSKGLARASVLKLVEDIIYSAKPADEKAAETISRFAYFIKNQAAFDPETVEKYVLYEDRSVVNTIKRQNATQSGYMTGKQNYLDHCDARHQEPEVVPSSQAKAHTEPPVHRADAANAVHASAAVANASAAHTVHTDHTQVQVQPVKPHKSSVVVRPVKKTYLEGEEATTILNEEEATALLNEEEEATVILVEEENTAILNQEEEDTTLLGAVSELDEDATALLTQDDEGTVLLAGNQQVHYPSLLRIQTQETIFINKPVFRLGKEKSYVDYFVSNNNAVSRSHADIITRGEKCFVMDLNSKNHTFINGQMIPVQCETEIHDGDHLKLGNEEFVFTA